MRPVTAPGIPAPPMGPAPKGQSPWLWGPLAGLMGGLLGAVLVRVVWNDDKINAGLPGVLFRGLNSFEWFYRLDNGIFFGLMFLSIGFTIFGWPRLIRGEIGRAFGDAGIGAATGGGGGFLGGLVTIVLLYDVFNSDFGDVKSRIRYLVGFAIIGLLLGLFFALRCAPRQVGVAIGLVTAAAVIAGQIWKTAFFSNWLASFDSSGGSHTTAQTFVFSMVTGVLFGVATAAVETVRAGVGSPIQRS